MNSNHRYVRTYFLFNPRRNFATVNNEYKVRYLNAISAVVANQYPLHVSMPIWMADIQYRFHAKYPSHPPLISA